MYGKKNIHNVYKIYNEKTKASEIAINLLDVLDNETIAAKTGLTIEEIQKLKWGEFIFFHI